MSKKVLPKRKKKRLKTIIPRPEGHPPKFILLDFQDAYITFFPWCVEHDYIPDVEGLASYLDTTRKTILDYEDKEEFSYTIKKIKTKIAFFKKQLAFKGKMNPAVFCFDFKNNHGYKNVDDHNVSMAFTFADLVRQTEDE